MKELSKEPCPDCPAAVFGLKNGKVPPITYVLPGDQQYQLVSQAAGCASADGSLALDQQELHGYQKIDGRFHPAWPPCVERVLGVFKMDDGVGVAARCNHHEHEKFTKPILLDDCRGCPLRREPVRLKILRTAEEFLRDAEERAAAKLKARLGEDIFDRAEENLKAWRAGRR